MAGAQHQDSTTTPADGRSQVNKLLLTVREAADMLGIGRSKAYELLARGELRSVYIDGCRRVPAHAVEEYVARLLQEAA